MMFMMMTCGIGPAATGIKNAWVGNVLLAGSGAADAATVRRCASIICAFWQNTSMAREAWDKVPRVGARVVLVHLLYE